VTWVVPPAPHRDDPAQTLDERGTLNAFLEFHRLTFSRKLEGLTLEQLRIRAAPSTMSLLGLVRHLADVERGWWRGGVAGETVWPNYYSPEDPDGDFDNVDDVDTEDAVSALADLAEQQERARAIVAAHSLEDTFEHRRQGTTSVRWTLVHLVEEYARHNGHADLLRERIDGSVGE